MSKPDKNPENEQAPEAPVLTADEARGINTLLSRVDLKGAEAFDFVALASKLNQTIAFHAAKAQDAHNNGVIAKYRAEREEEELLKKAATAPTEAELAALEDAKPSPPQKPKRNSKSAGK